MTGKGPFEQPTGVARLVPLAVIAFLVFSGCAENPKERKTTAETAEQTQLPEYVLHNVTHSFYDGDTIKLRVEFEKGAYFAVRQVLAVENCAYVYYDSRGDVLSRGRSKRATLFSGSPRLVAEDDVVVVSEVNGGVLRTNVLEWRGDKNQFLTNDFVTVRRVNGDMISGKGMVADLALRVVTIKRNVKGHFQEIGSPSS